MGRKELLPGSNCVLHNIEAIYYIAGGQSNRYLLFAYAVATNPKPADTEAFFRFGSGNGGRRTHLLVEFKMLTSIGKISASLNF